MKRSNKRPFWWILGGIVLVGTALLVWVTSGVSPVPAPNVIPGYSYRAVGTQIVVSVVFTNTTGQPLICAPISNVALLIPEGWTTSRLNNSSTPDPLLLRPRQVGSYQVQIPQATRRFQITSYMSPIAWHWSAISAVEKWIPHWIGKILGKRFEKSCRFLPVSSLEIEINGDSQE